MIPVECESAFGFCFEGLSRESHEHGRGGNNARRAQTRPDWASDCLFRAVRPAQLEALQARYLAYRAKLRSDGVRVTNGPLREQSDPSLRGLSILSCDLDEARRASDLDPSLQAGRLTYDMFEWWVAAGTLAFPGAAVDVGERRAMPDE